MSSNGMPKESSGKIDLLQGTLDMLILRTLVFGQAHGHQIAKHVQETTEEVLQIEHGSLYPALHRLERKGWVVQPMGAGGEGSDSGSTNTTGSRPRGRSIWPWRNQKWKRLTGAIARIMWPAEKEGA